MKAHERLIEITVRTTVLSLLLLLLSCTDRDAPDPATVQKLLDSFYNAQGFRIVSLDLGVIEGVPLSQKTYGKKRTYYVTVKQIRLEGKGRQISGGNVVINIRQKTGTIGEWEIERMPPELAP